MIDITLTNMQAFLAMTKFLEIFYKNTSSDDIGSLLGDLQLSPEGKTFDPAALNDWTKCVNKVLEEKSEDKHLLKMTGLQAFLAMTKFLEIFYKNTFSDDVGLLLSGMQLFPEGGTFDPAAWADWIKCVNEVLGEDNKNTIDNKKVAT